MKYAQAIIFPTTTPAQSHKTTDILFMYTIHKCINNLPFLVTTVSLRWFVISVVTVPYRTSYSYRFHL